MNIVKRVLIEVNWSTQTNCTMEWTISKLTKTVIDVSLFLAQYFLNVKVLQCYKIPMLCAMKLRRCVWYVRKWHPYSRRSIRWLEEQQTWEHLCTQLLASLVCHVCWLTSGLNYCKLSDLVFELRGSTIGEPWPT